MGRKRKGEKMLVDFGTWHAMLALENLQWAENFAWQFYMYREHANCPPATCSVQFTLPDYTPMDFEN